MRHVLSLIAMAALTACGSAVPTAPAPPTPPPAPAFLPVSAGVTLPPTCPATGCSYTFQARNEGPGCGRAVRGTLSLVNGGVVGASDTWALDTGRVIKVRETFDVEDCCVSDADLRPETVIRITFEAEAVVCP